ncbi:lipase class 3 family protein [Arabidopsis thaliana]|uniref:Lipase class 3 family protein n=1 Tax=Arabidopsis thaliana TaxID=3702 RepID=A0A1P8B3W4_ARATH|nr:lipase class 3 family protein [Arabidopsis thaliana]ANM66299.1 lipase class 3 family protein [Arabidopsis thaliana]|eukprot:NP_001328205.1 lipase class 3 family protein [Arabidopsis thaliana]
MAAGVMVTATGAVVILYLLSRRIVWARNGEDDSGGELGKSGRSGRRRIVRRPAQAPATWLETISTLSETLRFTYSETLGKWPIADLAFGINYLMRRQGNFPTASVYAGSNCIELKGPEIIMDLTELLRFLTLCMLFSKKPFAVFLESAGYTHEDVLLQKPKAGIMQPAFTIIRDTNSKCILLLIRGTHSIKDTLTAATGAVVPFHHSVLHDGGLSNLVLGYAHCGMVAAARWIAKLSVPCLLKALDENPSFKVQIVGHSLGGGTASLLTYILREQKEFASATCFTFAPAACMTWDLAESGKHFITTIINGSDLVPTFSASSVDDLRSEILVWSIYWQVTSSSWSNDLRDQVEHTRVLSVVYRSATAIGSRLPSIASAKAKVAGAGAILRPVSSGTQVMLKRAQDVAQAVVQTRSTLSSWSCIGPRRRAISSQLNSKVTDMPEASAIMAERRSTEALLAETVAIDRKGHKRTEHSSSSSSESDRDEPDEEEEEEPLISIDQVIAETSSIEEDVTEGELWDELDRELTRQENERDSEAMEEEAAAAKEITEEETVITGGGDSSTGQNQSPVSASSMDLIENQRFYPPGKIMHIVSVTETESETERDEVVVVGTTTVERVRIYETPRELYRKIRLSRTMINDHYMPMYKKMMELLITELECDSHSS